MLISNAFAQAATTAAADPTGGIMGYLPMVGLVIFFWFFMIRPQMKKSKEAAKMMSSLQVGDEVMTNSGIGGTISKIGDSYMKIAIAENVEITVQKQAIAAMLPPGTLNSL